MTENPGQKSTVTPPRTLTKKESLRRGLHTLVVQVVFVGIALLVVGLTSIDAGEDPDDKLLNMLLFIAGAYAFIGAVVRVMAHGADPKDDYWGKQLGAAGALVALVGGAWRVDTLREGDSLETIAVVIGLALIIVAGAAIFNAVRRRRTAAALLRGNG